MSGSKPVRSVLAGSVVAFATVGALALPVVSAASAVSATSPASSLSPAAASGGSGSWFHDPVTRADRAREVAVPRQPGHTVGERVRHTRAFFRARNGSLAVPARWARGHDLTRGQAVVLQGRAFTYDDGGLTPSTRRRVISLAHSLTGVRSVRCQGHADFGGTPGGERALSKRRAYAVCRVIASHTRGLTTRSYGFGIFRPVVIGGQQRNRINNRRVVVKVTRVRAATAPQATPSDAPTLSSAIAADTSIAIAFQRPADDGGAAITQYQASTDGGVTWRDVVTSGTGPFTATISGLAPGTSYTVAVRALNRAGSSAASNSITVTTTAGATPPTAPAITSMASDTRYDPVVNHSVYYTDMTFTAPTSDGGSPVTGYEVSVDGGAFTALTYTGTGPYTARISQAAQCDSYSYRIRAVNAVGTGPVSASVVNSSWCD